MKPVTFRSETRERRLQTVRGHRSPAQRRSRPCRYGRSPEVTPGPAATFDHRPHAQSTTVASLTAAPKDVSRSMSCPKHFLTYRGVKMSRSSRNRRTSRRSRRISSRSSVRRPSLRSPPSRAACATQVRMAWDDGSNSRASSPGVRGLSRSLLNFRWRTPCLLYEVVYVTPRRQPRRRAEPARPGRRPSAADHGSPEPAGSASRPPPARSPPSVESSGRRATA